MKRIVILAVCAFALIGCDNKPKHYFVMCEATDTNGWKLVDSKQQDGYLVSCTYQSPDRQNGYTSRCDDNGCGIK